MAVAGSRRVSFHGRVRQVDLGLVVLAVDTPEEWSVGWVVLPCDVIQGDARLATDPCFAHSQGGRNTRSSMLPILDSQPEVEW